MQPGAVANPCLSEHVANQFIADVPEDARSSGFEPGVVANHFSADLPEDARSSGFQPGVDDLPLATRPLWPHSRLLAGALEFFFGKDGWVGATDRAFAEREANAGGHPWPAGPGPLGNSSSSALPASGKVCEHEEEPLPSGWHVIDENDTTSTAASSCGDGQSVAPAIDQPVYCPDCEMWMHNRAAWERHQIGKKHRKCLQRTAWDSDDPDDAVHVRFWECSENWFGEPAPSSHCAVFGSAVAVDCH